jgi:hypothetical protein
MPHAVEPLAILGHVGNQSIDVEWWVQPEINMQEGKSNGAPP